MLSLYLVLTLMLFMNFIFLMLQHPLAMIFVLVAQTILISVVLFLLLHYAWFSYSLILVFLGGMLVIFMYMSNLASNEMFKPKLALLTLLPASVACWLMVDIYLPSVTSTSELNYSNEMFMISKPFYFSIMPMMILSAALIIITMLAVVKITKMQLGPLRIS